MNYIFHKILERGKENKEVAIIYPMATGSKVTELDNEKYLQKSKQLNSIKNIENKII